MFVGEKNGPVKAMMAQRKKDLEMERDAERYRKLKDKASPFVVHYYGSWIKPNDPDRAVLTQHLDALVDSWPDGAVNPLIEKSHCP